MIANPLRNPARAGSLIKAVSKEWGAKDRSERKMRIDRIVSKHLFKKQSSEVKRPITTLLSSDLQSVESLKTILKSSHLLVSNEFDSSQLNMFSQVFFKQAIAGSKKKRRKLFEAAYSILGMVSGTGVTWNAFATEVLVNTLGIFVGGYSSYTSKVSPSKWAGMILLNIHTFPTLYVFNGGQMFRDAQAICDHVVYRASSENSSSWGRSMIACLKAPFVSTYPQIEHWSESIVTPFVWTFSIFNTIPEMMVIIPRLINQKSNPSTLLGVPLAFTQRVGSQRRALEPMLHKYYMFLADRASTPKIRQKRQEMLEVTLGLTQRIRSLRTQKSDQLNVLYNTLYPGRVKGHHEDIGLITEHGILTLLFGWGGRDANANVNDYYQESRLRKAIRYTSGALGIWGSIASAMIIEEGVSSVFEYFNVEKEVSRSVGKTLATLIGIPRAISMFNNMSTYALRVHDAFNNNKHYKESGLRNPYLSDVIYGKNEFKVLIASYFEAAYWSLLYYGLALPILQNRGMDAGAIASLIVPTVAAQAAFEATQQMENIDIVWHKGQLLRSRAWWGNLWDKVCCCRGRKRVTKNEHFKGTSNVELKQSVRALKLLQLLDTIEKVIEVSPPQFVSQLHYMYIERNPFLSTRGLNASEEKGDLEQQSAHQEVGIALIREAEAHKLESTQVGEENPGWFTRTFTSLTSTVGGFFRYLTNIGNPLSSAT